MHFGGAMFFTIIRCQRPSLPARSRGEVSSVWAPEQSHIPLSPPFPGGGDLPKPY